LRPSRALDSAATTMRQTILRKLKASPFQTQIPSPARANPKFFPPSGTRGEFARRNGHYFAAFSENFSTLAIYCGA
jgi:hypothetical protein